MAEYHYKYDPPQGGSDKNSNNTPNKDELLSWIILIGSFALGLWPLGVFLIIRKVIQSGSQSNSNTSAARRAQRQSGSYRYTYQSTPSQSAQSQSAPAAPSQKAAAAQTSRDPKPQAGRGFLIGGGIITGLFGLMLLSSLPLALDRAISGQVVSMLAFLAGCTGIGISLLYTGFSRRKKARLYLKYLGLIGRRESVSISTLASAAGRGYKKVCGELQEMLDTGILPPGYLDLAGDRLVLSAQGIEDEPVEETRAAVEPEKDDNDILSEIRAVNDAIPDPVMSAKIDRIGEITGKILDYQRKNPGKAGQLRSFLNYYLPTTLKILRAYAQLDQQGVEGENISAAKARIEGMMDKVVEGFEKQLDKLFQDDALDITSDVAVLEKMLDNDGLGSDTSPFGTGTPLGG